MEIRVYFDGNKKVNADFDGFTVATDQPQDAGGDGSAPSPFDIFLASIGTCAGAYILGFCQKRNISLDGVEIVQKMDWNEEKHLVSKITLEINVPANFPEQHRDSLVKFANLCTVKRHLFEPPQFDVVTVVT